MNSNSRKKTFIEIIKERSTSKDPIIHSLSEKLVIESSLSYNTLHKRACSIAAHFQKNKIYPGQRILVSYENAIEFICGFVGCMYANVIPVPTYPPLNKALIKKFYYISKNSGTNTVLSSSKLIKKIKILKYLNKFKLVGIDSDSIDFNFFSWINSSKIDINLFSSYKETEINQDDIAFLQYTSGSTSDPKGVIVTQHNLIENLKIIKSSLLIDGSTRGFSWIPFYHDMGLIGNILEILYSNATLYVMSPLCFISNPILWLYAIEKFNITHTGGPDFSYSLLIKKASQIKNLKLNLSSLKVSYCGSEPIQAITIKNFYNAFSQYKLKSHVFMPCYGMAEATLYISGGVIGGSDLILKVDKKSFSRNLIKISDNIKSDDILELVSCGEPAYDVKIVDPNTNMPCKKNQIGEIWLSGESVTSGYWNSPVSQENTYFSNMKNKNHIKYLKTGDLGFIFKNKLYITGRLKDLIIIHGVNYYPQEIEKLIEGLDPLIKIGRVCVFKLTSRSIDGICVVIGLSELRVRQKEIEDLFNFIVEKIYEEYSIPVVKIVFVKKDEILRTTSGKIRRSEIRKNLIENKINIIASSDKMKKNNYLPPRDQGEKDLCKIFENLLNQKRIGVEDNLFDYGCDSIIFSMAVSQIKLKFKKEISLSEIYNYPYVSKINKILNYLPEVKLEKGISYKKKIGLFESYQATKIQHNLYRCYNHNPYSNTAVFRIKFHSSIKFKIIECAIKEIFKKYTILRTSFYEKGNVLYCKTYENPVTSVNLNYFDKIYDRVEDFHHYLQEPLSIEKPELIRIFYSEVENKTVVVMIIHHIVFDYYFLKNLMSFLINQIYSNQDVIEKKIIPFSDIAAYQNSILKENELFSNHKKYWKTIINDKIDPIFLKNDYSITSSPIQRMYLTKELVDEAKIIKKICSSFKMSYFSVIMTLCHLTLFKLIKIEVTLIGTSVSLNFGNIENVLDGPCYNTIPYVCHHKERNDPLSIFKSIENQHVENFSHDQFPFPLMFDGLEKIQTELPYICNCYVNNKNEDKIIQQLDVRSYLSAYIRLFMGFTIEADLTKIKMDLIIPKSNKDGIKFMKQFAEEFKKQSNYIDSVIS